MNRELSEAILQNLSALGVREWCACAGARNSPLFDVLLDRPELVVTRFFEERSAAFFALGRIKATGRPVAVLTTSGTAAAELFPAVIEAHYSGLPLIAVTADRPRRYRGTGAPQSIEQVGLFGQYAAVSLDIAPGESLPRLASDARAVWHLNVCFEEPLLGGTLSAPPPIVFSRRQTSVKPEREKLTRFLREHKRPLIVVGPTLPEEREALGALARSLHAPILAETASGLRGALGDYELQASERIVGELGIDSILRLGGVPTFRLWRDLDGKLSSLPVLSISALPFTGLARGEMLSPGAWLNDAFRTQWTLDSLREANERDRARRRQLDDLLERFPRSEPGFVRAYSRLVPSESPLYLGNSLPIREWDLAATGGKVWRRVGVNRGANGIDGQLSTFLGFCEPAQTSWALLGDLTTLYDLSAPWVLSQLPQLSFVLGVMHNGGGQIFARMFARPEFQNRHATGFESWAAMWNLPYERWDEIPAAWTPSRAHILELRPDEAQTQAFWREHDELWK